MYYVFIGSTLDGSFKMNIMSLKIFVRKKVNIELVIWSIFMTFMLFFQIYSLILVLNQETPLFTRHHMGNECFVISSTSFLIMGFINLQKIRKSLSRRNVGGVNSEKNNVN
jgi:hypothetical protein